LFFFFFFFFYRKQLKLTRKKRSLERKDTSTFCGSLTSQHSHADPLTGQHGVAAFARCAPMKRRWRAAVRPEQPKERKES
jgi:hypothetical protein